MWGNGQMKSVQPKQARFSSYKRVQTLSRLKNAIAYFYCRFFPKVSKGLHAAAVENIFIDFEEWTPLTPSSNPDVSPTSKVDFEQTRTFYRHLRL